MDRFTPQERGIIVSMFLRNNLSVIKTQREFRRRFPHRLAPIGSTIRRFATRLEATGSTLDRPKSGRPRTGRSAENIDAVREDVEVSRNINEATCHAIGHFQTDSAAYFNQRLEDVSV